MRRAIVPLAAGSVTALAASLAAWGRAGAQVVTVDEGTFALTRAGVPIGREEFRIIRQPAAGGTAYAARGVAVYDGRRITPALQTDSAGTPLRYQLDVRRGGRLEERVTAQAGAGGHFTAQVQRPAGEGAREYLLSDGVVIADDEVYHELYFLGRRAVAGAHTVRVLVPRTDAQLTVTVTRAGAEPVRIAGHPVAATHYTLADTRGAWRRELWVDAEGRVLRVFVPGAALDAVREDPPR